MNKTNFLNHLFVLILFVGVTLACSETSEKTKDCGNNPFLKPLLNSKDKREASELLMQHGPVQQEELPCIVEAIDSSNDKKRVFAAQLLTIVHGDEKVIFEAQKKVVLETKDVLVWSEVIDFLIEHENPNAAELSAKRHDMIKNALDYTNKDDKELQGKTQSVGLKAGVLGKYPNIEDDIKKRLNSDNSELVSVALDAQLPDMARNNLPLLLKMLEEYEAGKTYTGFRDEIFPSLIDALIRTEDEKAFAAARTALEKGLTNAHQTKGAREEFGSTRNRLVFVKGGYVEKFCFYLIRENSIAKPSAFDILTTPIWADNREPTVEIVKKCVELIEKGNLSTDKRKHWDDITGQSDCEKMFYFLETNKNPISAEGDVKHGSDALLIGQKWLKEN